MRGNDPKQDAIFSYVSADFDESVSGLRVFFEMIRDHPGPHAVTNRMVDDLWHTFILFTPQYREFCSRFFGKYVDHQPNTKTTPVPVEAFSNFFHACSHRFGDVPYYWTKDIPIDIMSDLSAGKSPHLDGIRWSGWTG